MLDQIKVLVVDDSSIVRRIISDILESDPMIKVVGTANNGETAIYKSDKLDPDVITMDIEMPILNGLEALRRIIEQNPKPVIMMSVLTQHGAEATFKALDYGAVDFIPKPSSMMSISVDEIGSLLISKVKSVYESNINFSRKETTIDKSEEEKKKCEIDRVFEKSSSSSKIIGIGTSTGGPSALHDVFRTFPENFPSSVVVVQHMPEGFTKLFSERLDTITTLNVKEAEDKDKIIPGWGYIAPGDLHVKIEKKNNESILRVFQGDKVSGHRPSIDVLFDSLADTFGKHSIAVLMTGMGKDGADGIFKVKSKGGYTIAQDEKSSVVFGMNRVAIQKGAIEDIVSLSEITKKIVEHI